MKSTIIPYDASNLSVTIIFKGKINEFFFFLAIVMFMRFYHRLNMEKNKKRMSHSKPHPKYIGRI